MVFIINQYVIIMHGAMKKEVILQFRHNSNIPLPLNRSISEYNLLLNRLNSSV